MGFTGTVRLAGAACVALLLAVNTAQARDDASLDDFFSEYRALAHSPKTLPVFPMPLCGGGEVERAPGYVAGDGTGDFAFVVADGSEDLESVYRLERGGDCVTELEFSLPLEVDMARGGVCTLVVTEELVALPRDGEVLHNIAGLSDQNLGCFVTYKLNLQTDRRTRILDSSVVSAQASSFNPSPYSADIKRPVFTTVNRMATLRTDGSYRFTNILRTGNPVPTASCPTAVLAEMRARPAVSRNRILSTAEFNETSCGGDRDELRMLVVTYDADADSYSAIGVDATTPATGELVLPSVLIGHPDFEIFMTNGVNQETRTQALYYFDVAPGGDAVTAARVEDLYADVGVEPGLLPVYRSLAPGYTASGQPVMLGAGECQYRGVVRGENCLVAFGPAPGSTGAQQSRRLARIAGWGRALPGYPAEVFPNVRFAIASGPTVLLSIDAFLVDLTYLNRSYTQVTIDGYRPSVAAGDKLRFGRALKNGKLRVEQVRPLAREPLSNRVTSGATGRGFAPADRVGEEAIAGLREASVKLDVYDAAGDLVSSRGYPRANDTRALFRLRDFNGSGSDELAVAGFDDNGRTVVTVKDGRSGKLLGTWSFAAVFRPEFAAMVDDVNGNGSEEFAILGIDPDGEIRAHLRDGSTGKTITRISFGDGTRAVGFTAVANRQGQRRWLTVLTTDDDGKTTAITRNTGNGNVVSRVGFGTDTVPLVFGTHSGIGDEAGGVLVLVGMRPDQGNHRVILKHVVSGNQVAAFGLPRNFSPVDVTEVKDYAGDGVTDLLFVSTDLAGQIRLTVKEPTTGRTIKQFLVD
jgi:hypothetical protein